MIDYLTHNIIYNQRHCFLMDIIIKMMVNLLYDDISQFPASWFLSCVCRKELLLTEPWPFQAAPPPASI